MAREYHVSVNGTDANPGTAAKPLRTISQAARMAQPGDLVIVHTGTYREKVAPARGGLSDEKRIVYQAAEGEQVHIKGSEVIKGWKRVKGTVWQVTLPNGFFGDSNPYRDELHGDWFSPQGRVHHTGEVFLNGRSLFEVPTLEAVLDPKPLPRALDPQRSLFVWYCEADAKQTRIYANFQEHDPNKELVEITVRDSCFYPARPGVDYITVCGFELSQAATQWAPPTAEQIGLIGTHWSKGWVIENNIVHDSKCVGISLGKDRATGQNVWSNNPRKDGATHYNEVIFRALRAGWSKKKIGSHVVRNNVIYNCEQAGVVGSLGAVFSRIENNHIYDIWTKRQFAGAEIAGIKIHAAIDVVIRQNHIHNTGRGIWLDWMAQGTRVTRNLLYDNTTDDLFVEVNHGPFLVDNNMFLSPNSLRCWSQGGAWGHNLFNGRIEAFEEIDRCTPYHVPHSTWVAAVRSIHGGENRFYNNIFTRGYPELRTRRTGHGRRVRWLGYGLEAFNQTTYVVLASGNVYLKGAEPYMKEKGCRIHADFDPQVRIEQQEDRVVFLWRVNREVLDVATQLISTQLLGKTLFSNQGFENPDGSPLVIDRDFFGTPRDRNRPTPGPFEKIKAGRIPIAAWKGGR
ncbi:MAG TPA: DUF1565 domain-containing protein [Planctomycetaceae bacterium]|nr:DUF1565 domain-containing protein [Planctomycetaceae bacterium]